MLQVSPPPQGGQRPQPSQQWLGLGKGGFEPPARSCGRGARVEHAVRKHRCAFEAFESQQRRLLFTGLWHATRLAR